MGVLTDFFIGDDEIARTLDEAIPPGHADRVDLKGILQVELSYLQCILMGCNWNVEMVDEYEPLFEASDEGPWVCRVPVALVDRLAEIQETELDNVARSWWAIDEFQPGIWGKGWELSEVKGHLTELVKLAKRCETERKSLYMWICL